MSHIHLPDGILPAWLWILGYVAVALYLLYFFIYCKKSILNKKIPLVGIFAALMLITMSIEIIPPIYHINLAALSGIILGPNLSILAILVVNIILAFLGHGGVTVIGLNTLVISLEAVIAYFGFKFLYSKFKKIFASTLIAVFIALFVSSCATIGVVYLGTRDLSSFVEHHEHSDHHEEKEEQEEQENDEDFDLKKFILLVMSLSLVGWTLESAITAFIVNYINNVRPDILDIKETQEEE